MATIDEVKAKLKKDPAARKQFLADATALLKKHGVNTDDPESKKKLGNDAAFEKALSSSGWACTVVSG